MIQYGVGVLNLRCHLGGRFGLWFNFNESEEMIRLADFLCFPELAQST